MTWGADAQSYAKGQARILWDCMTQDIFFTAALKGTDEECGGGRGRVGSSSSSMVGRRGDTGLQGVKSNARAWRLLRAPPREDKVLETG